jgi:hypothetical protein
LVSRSRQALETVILIRFAFRGLTHELAGLILNYLCALEFSFAFPPYG